ncbi:Lipase domain-containing protein [Sergentomyia squamirostris]
MKASFCVTVVIFFKVYSVPVEVEPETQKWELVPDADGTLHLEDVSNRLMAENSGLRINLVDVVFILSTRSTSKQVIGLGDTGSLTESSFNPKNPTRFVIHGWLNNADSDINQLIPSAYLSRGDFNVFIVDWSNGASLTYGISAILTGSVGNIIANFIRFLCKETGMKTSDVTLIGHSLGAHVAGYAGKRMAENEKIGVIVGLDPAGPIFTTALPSMRLHYTDADYVETIHTNACILGFCQSVGVASFFPNYGNLQSGCSIPSCSHSRAYQYFAESITDRGFYALKCSGYTDIVFKYCRSSGEKVLMGGEPIAVKSEGVYWLKTNKNKPFAMGNS